MKRKLLVIGIGAGNPDFVTVQAVNAMNMVDVFFIPDKGAEKGELADVRRTIIERHVSNRAFRTVEYRTPVRRPKRDYEETVSDWHDEIADVFAGLLGDDLGPDETGAFLVWGDPTLYDSTIRVLERVQKRGDIELDYEVLPGISSIQALAARHKVALANIGRSILYSTGRVADEEFPENADSMVVMLNAEMALRAADGDLDIFWGAYVGMDDEILVSGRLADVIDEIEQARAEARREKGWIMDSVLFKKKRDPVG